MKIENERNESTAASGVASSDLLEEAKAAESRAWYRLHAEGVIIDEQIQHLKEKRDLLQEDWANKYGQVSRINKLLSSNVEVSQGVSDAGASGVETTDWLAVGFSIRRPSVSKHFVCLIILMVFIPFSAASVPLNLLQAITDFIDFPF